MSRIINNFNAKRAIIYLFILLTILNCASIYYSPILNNLWRLLLFIIFGVCVSKIPKDVFDKFIEFSFLLSGYVLIFLILNYLRSPSFNVISYIISFALEPIMLIGFFLAQSSEGHIKYYIYVLEDIVVVLGIISLAFWILSILGLKPNMSFVTHWGGTNSIPGYFGLDFMSQNKITFLGISRVLRNCGIFAEPPMYSYILCIALLIELFIRKTNTVFTFKAMLLFVVIISTTSTTGLLIAIPAILLKMFICTNNNIKRFVIIILIPIFIFMLELIFQNKKGDININSFAQSSYLQRHDDIISCLHAWMYHPLLGNGINNPDVGEEFNISPFFNYHISKVTIGGTTGLMDVLAHGGIINALLYIVPSVLYALRSLSSSIFVVMSFLLFVFTGVDQSFIYIMILSYFWSCVLLNK